MVWDEENRLRGINDNGRLHLYTYDHTGERALKSSAESSMAVINGLASAVITHTEDYTAYISPYFVVQKGKFTKHYFEGTTRIVSKLGEGTFSHKNTGIMAGGIDYLKRTQKEQEARDRYIKGLQVPPGPPTQHGIYTTPEWTGEAYPSADWSEVSQNQEPPQGWPRPPKFNEPGDVPGPPVQFGEAITNANVKAGYGYINNGVEEKNLYYYHPDHLGSSSYITDKNGEVIQHTEYIAFGETFVDEHSVSNKQPYLFNGKELDYETGLYYYGARYYDPKVSIFLNVDPLVEKTMSPYAYVNNNPVNLIDSTGMEAEDCPNCPKPQYQEQRLYTQGNTYAAISSTDNKTLEWVKETTIQEIVIHSEKAQINNNERVARARLRQAEATFWGTKPDAISLSYGGSIHGIFFNANAKVGIAINLWGGDIGIFGSIGGNLGIHPELPGFNTGIQVSQHNNYGGNKDVIEGLGGWDTGYSASLFVGGEVSKSASKVNGILIPESSGVSTTSLNLGIGYEASKTSSVGRSLNISKSIRK